MENTQNGLSAFQTFVLCVSSASLGTVCLAPFFGGADGSWNYAVILAAALSAAAAAIYIRTLRKTGTDSFSGFLAGCLHPAAVKILLALAGVFFAAEAALSAYYAADAAGLYLLEKTPYGAALALLLITSCILFDHGMQYLSRCCEILFLMLVLPVSLLLLICIVNVDASEAAVAFQPDPSGIFRLFPAALISCAGGASAVILFRPSRNRNRAGNIGAAAGGFAYIAVNSIVLYSSAAGIFTTDGTAVLTYPFIEMARSVSIGNISLTERFDVFFISAMILSLLLQIALFCCCSAECIKELSGLSSHRCFTWLLLPVVFAAAYYAQYESFSKVLSQTAFRGTLAVFLCIIPAVSIAAAVFRKVKGAGTNA